MTRTKQDQHVLSYDEQPRAPGGMRRLLKKEDLQRMWVPDGFWKVNFDRISAGDHKDLAEDFCCSMGHVFEPGEPMRNGYSVIFWGDNDCGKTSAAIVMLMAARRRGFNGLFIRAVQYRNAVMSREMYNPADSVARRCLNVDLLVLDDLCKEASKQVSSGGTERMFEELLRDRTSNRKSTIVTMNSNPKNMHERYEKSFERLISERFVMQEIVGPSQRKIEQQPLIDFFQKEDKE